MWAAETLKEWRDFYVLMGTAGATLLGLLFIAVSLGAGYLTEERQSATRTFMSPVVVHFTTVFFLSAIALFPSHQARFFAALIGGTALIGAIISTYITIQIVRTDLTNYVEDYLAYGLLPASVTSRCSLPPCQSIWKRFWAECAGRGSFAIGNRQHPRRYRSVRPVKDKQL